MAAKKKSSKKNLLKAENKKVEKREIETANAALLTATVAAAAVKATTIAVTFTGGLGNLTATLFKNLTGAIIGHDSLSASGSIIFNNANTGDAISINGVCTGKAVINIDVATDPPTPVKFTAGNINFGFDIL
jgi:hypothetical protein